VFSLAHLQTVLLGVGMVIAAVLLTIWWRQQTFRWPIVLVICLVGAPLLSWGSAMAFQVVDYRAGCDGLCPGYSGAPVPIFQGETAGNTFMPGMLLLSSLIYLVVLLGWGAITYALLSRTKQATQLSGAGRFLAALIILAAPFMLAPLYVPPAEAHVRGDPQRIAINAQREVYMYDHLASAPVWGVGLEDVRPRPDGSPGMRVCLRTYTFFYVPTGHLYLDMAPEGVHSTGGGMVPQSKTCWDS
jgi:hypothetical protein